MLTLASELAPATLSGNPENATLGAEDRARFTISRVALQPGRGRSAGTGLGQGDRFGPASRYELGRVLGEGGSGVVHEAVDHVLGRCVAVKTVRQSESGHEEKALYLEARATASLEHERIIQIYDFVTVGERPYLIMERFGNGTLQPLIGSGRLRVGDAIGMVLELATALQHAHRLGVLHLDIKPGNVLIDEHGKIKLIDFGVGSSHRVAYSQGGVSEESVAGTPQYMAPEQWELGDVDERTDIWALGVLLHELLCDQPPSDAPSSAALAMSRTTPRLSETLHLPASVDVFLSRTFARSPEDRFSSAGEAAVALCELSAEVARAAPKLVDVACGSLNQS